MSTTPVLYALCAVKIDGKSLSEATDVSLKTTLGRIPAKTLQKGLSGYTPGVEMLEISISSGVPVNGFEASANVEIGTSIFHTIEIIFGAKSLVTQGWFEDEDDGQGTGAEAKQTLKLCAFPAVFK